MSPKSVCLKVSKAFGERAITLSNRLGILNKELEVRKDDTFIRIPLNRPPSAPETEKLKKQLPNYEILTCDFRERKKKKSLIELLEDKLPPHLLASLPRAIDFVGDIAIVEFPSELEDYETVVGKAIMQASKNVRTVLAKASAVSGSYRLRKFRVVAGEHKTDTVHKEYSCQYYVDLAKAYFSPRLSYEHNRVASLVEDGETVLDLFAGIGPFAILIAKTHRNVKVYAVDTNPHAVEFLKKNIRLNRVEDKVQPILGDARQVIAARYSGAADRVIMNLPEKALEYVDVACMATKSNGGVLHFYGFVKEPDSLENMTLRFTETVENHGRKVEKILSSKLVRATAPYEWQVVLDAKIH
jgi:tRNA (guanine37-N1)-methyltransferase